MLNNSLILFFNCSILHHATQIEHVQTVFLINIFDEGNDRNSLTKIPLRYIWNADT